MSRAPDAYRQGALRATLERLTPAQRRALHAFATDGGATVGTWTEVTHAATHATLWTGASRTVVALWQLGLVDSAALRTGQDAPYRTTITRFGLEVARELQGRAR